MSRFTVVYDANVLYPAPLRDLLMRLAATGLFRARWTDRIHDEWMRNVLKKDQTLTLLNLMPPDKIWTVTVTIVLLLTMRFS